MTSDEVLRAAARLMRERMDAPQALSSDARFVRAVADWLDAQANLGEDDGSPRAALAVAHAYLEEA